MFDFIKLGKIEIEIVNFFDFCMCELGVFGLFFDMILVSGINFFKFYVYFMYKLVELGEVIIMDFGCFYDYYVSDMIWIIYLGYVSDE